MPRQALKGRAKDLHVTPHKTFPLPQLYEPNYIQTWRSGAIRRDILEPENGSFVIIDRFFRKGIIRRQ